MLIGLLLPVASSAIATAERVKCQANLRSIMQGLTLYLDRNGEKLPYANLPVDASLNRLAPFDRIAYELNITAPTWDSVLNESINLDPWSCPSDKYYITATGTSYLYAPASMFSILGPDSQLEVSKTFLKNRSTVLFLDAEPSHSGSGHDRKNAAYSDSSVRVFTGSIIPN